MASLCIKIVLVRPHYPENVGLVARAMANFGFKELALVRPECEFKGSLAKSRACHGQSILLKAKQFESLGKALEGCSYAVATSAKARKNRPFLGFPAVAERLGKSHAKAALVFGPEPDGLSAKELDQCDFLARIPASKEYPTLNLSHAACIALFLLFSKKPKKPAFKEAGPESKKKLLELFEKDLEKARGITDKAMVKASFKALLSRSLLSEKEAKALAAFFARKGK